MSEINYFFETDFTLAKEADIKSWIIDTAEEEKMAVGCLNFIFCDDEYLHKINVEYLNHDTYTDIITFDNSTKDEISSDIFISVERVRENAALYDGGFEAELHRVMIHGVLHLLGYKDKTAPEQAVMSSKEDFYLSLRKFITDKQ